MALKDTTLLKNNGSFYSLKQNGMISLKDKPDGLKANFYDVSQSSAKEIKDYKEFINALRVLFAKYKNSKFSLLYFLSDRNLIVGVDKKANGKKARLQFIYEFEYPEIKDMIMDIFPFIQDQGNLSMWHLSSIKDNHLPLGVIRTLMTSRVLKYERDKFKKSYTKDQLKDPLVKEKYEEELKSYLEFHTFTKLQGNGKRRLITAPHKDMRNALREVNKILTATYDHRNYDWQVGYKKGKNIKSNIEIHRDNQFLVNLDIKDFYPSCKRILVEKYIRFMFRNVNIDLKDEFLDIILDEDTDALFIGSPISGTLANVIVSKPAEYMKRILAKTGKVISVYADDITVSTNVKMSKTYIRNVFKRAFEEYSLEEYFKINPKKTVGRSRHRRRVTGLILNDKDQVSVPRRFYMDMRVKIHKLSLGYTNINKTELVGRIGHALYHDESGKVKRYLCKFGETVKKHRLISLEKMKEIGIVCEEEFDTTDLEVVL